MDFAQSGKLKAVTFSYDDGITQDMRLIELMNKYHLKGTFNVNSGRLGSYKVRNMDGHRVCCYRFHASDLPVVYEGHEIAAHTLDHPKLATLDDQEVIRQVEQDRLRLSDIAGYEVVGMAYPYGQFDDRVVDLIEKHTGIRYSRTTKTTPDFPPETDLLRWKSSVFHLKFDEMMDLGQQFVDLKTDTPKVFSIWGHSYELDKDFDNWAKLEAFFDLISNREDIFYGTNKEVLL